MLITRISAFTGITHSLEINITPDELTEYENGTELIQNKFPHLTSDEREFILSGVTKEEWDLFIK